MNPGIFLNNLHVSGLVFNLLVKSILITLGGWTAIKIFKNASAPVRSSIALTTMVFLLLLPFCFAASPVYDGLQFNTSISIAAGQPVTGGTLEPGAGSLTGKLNIVAIISVTGMIWVGGFLVNLFLLFFRLSYIMGFKNGLAKIEGKGYEQLVDTFRKSFGKDALPALYTSPAISSPITVGIFKPAIVIPEGLYHIISDDELNSIVHHEMSHILNRDHVTGLLQGVAAAMYWWNPFLHKISREFSRAREFISDNYAIRESSPRAYAECLLTLTEKTNLLNRMPGIAGMAGSNAGLKDRINNIIKKERNMQTKLKKSTILFVFLLSFCLVGVMTGYKVTFAAESPAAMNKAVAQADETEKEEVTKGKKIDGPKPKLVKKIIPEYPEEAVKKQLEDVVTVRATNDIYGKVIKVKVIEGKYKILNDAASAAVKQWVYEPYIINGEPKGVEFTVKVKFNLKKDKK